MLQKCHFSLIRKVIFHQQFLKNVTFFNCLCNTFLNRDWLDHNDFGFVFIGNHYNKQTGYDLLSINSSPEIKILI